MVLWTYPVDTIEASLANFLLLFRAPDYSDFNYHASQRSFFTDKLPAQELKMQRRTLAWRGEFPAFWPSVAGAAVALISLLFIVLNFWKMKSQSRELVVLAILFIGLNNFVCAAGSGVYTRYFARVIWLLPFVAFAVGWRLLRSRSA